MAKYQEYLSIIYIASIVFLFNIKTNCHSSLTPSVSVGQVGEDDTYPSVWLTISSVIDKINLNGKRYFFQRKLELNWKNVPLEDNSHVPMSGAIWVGLFDHQPSDMVNSDDALVSLQIGKSVAKLGRFKSDIEFPMYTFAPNNLTSDCLGYWIVLFTSQSTLAHDCIRAHPHWMEEILPFIVDKSLKELMIPGTHNSGSYELGYKSDASSILKKYIICQDESIFNQLAYGIRYLDLRVSYESVLNRPEVFWIVHGIFRTEVSLESVLYQVKAFLEATSVEIIIIDFHRFEKGFTEHPRDYTTNAITKSRHQLLHQLIESILGNYIARDANGYHIKVSQLLSSNKRLVIGYAGNRFIREANYFPKVRHLWAEAENVTKLESYLNRMICVETGYEATSAMAQLTPNTWGMIFDKYGGLRKLAQDVNWVISQWFSERWSNCANIVSTDFFLGNNVIDIAIKANRKRYVKPDSVRQLF